MDEQIKQLAEMGDEQVKKLKLVVFDIDGVIIPKGTDVHENPDGTEFVMRTHKLSKEFVDNIIELKKHVRIAFSSGRNLLYLKNLVKDFFDSSIILQAENGAMTFIDGRIIHPDYPDNYFDVLYGIRRLIAKDASALKLEGFEPKFFILTAHMEESNDMIYDIIKQVDADNIINCVWGGEAYDFGLKGVTKGSMIGKIAQMLNLGNDEILTTGNAMNDKEMLEFGVGVTVEPDVVWGKYKTSGKGLGGIELAAFLAERLNALDE
jgi:hydroxymethylpyrimidine pyrophosphatase-like HAD family hydrolase